MSIGVEDFVRIGTVVLTGVLFCAAALAVGENPNSTGVWKHNDNGRSTTYTIEHQDPNLTIVFRSDFSAGSMSGGLTNTETYTTDGVERERKSHTGCDSWTTVNWQGTALTILRVVKDQYRVSVTRETWMLSQDGGTLTKKRRTIAMDGVTENTEVFMKQ